jgi:hypothetical protein
VARILVQLKLRLLRNALRASTAAKVSFIVSTAVARARIHRAADCSTGR